MELTRRRAFLYFEKELAEKAGNAALRLQYRFNVTILRPATSIQTNGRLPTSRVTFSTVTEPIPRFNASVTSLRSGTTASRAKQCSMA